MQTIEDYFPGNKLLYNCLINLLRDQNYFLALNVSFGKGTRKINYAQD